MFLWNLSQAQTNVAAAVRTAGTQSRVAGYEDQVADSLRASLSGTTAAPLTLVVYKADPSTGRPAGLTGLGANFAACTADCYIFTWNASTRSWSKAGSPTWPASAQKACGPTAETDFVGVWLNTRNNGITGIGLARRTYATRGVARLEPVPLSTGQLCKP